MGSLLLEQIKKQTTNFLQEKYKSARKTFTDVTDVELLAEEATNKDDCSPDAKTMTTIAEASFNVDQFWRIVDVLHKRLYKVDWAQWRQSYKSLVVLEFMLTHGPEEFAQEFQCDAEVIEELGTFTHIDKKGFNWGSRMQKLSDQILKLLQGGEALKEARLRALKITTEIQGFGSSANSPTSSSSPEASQASPSFCSFSSTSSAVSYMDSNVDKNHLWDGLGSEEKIVLVDSDDDDDEEEEEEEEVRKPRGILSEICSEITGSHEKIEFRCLSDVGNKVSNKKKYERQYSLWF